MLHLFDHYAPLFKSWRIARYEQEGDAYLLHMSGVLVDDSRLELRDYLFADGSRKLPINGWSLMVPCAGVGTMRLTGLAFPLSLIMSTCQAG